MGIDNDFQVIKNTTETMFFVGTPMSLLGLGEHQNTSEARLLGIDLKDHYAWMVARGAKEIFRNEKTGFVLFAFDDKKKASKTAKELTKVYLKYRMAKTK